MSTASIEAALRLRPEIEDCRAWTRRTIGGKVELMVAAVPASTATADDVAACVDALHAELPTALVVLPSVPMREDGEWMSEATSNLAVLDAQTLAQAEAQAREATGLAAVAAVAVTRPAAAPPWHLSTLLPDWERPSMAPAADAPRAETTADASVAAAPPALCSGGELHVPPDAPTLLTDLLLRAAAAPAPAGLVVVRSDGREDDLSYADLLDGARRALAGLRRAGLKPGDPLILQLRRHDDFLVVFWACELGGIVPVPVGVPVSFADANGALRRVADAIELFDDPLVAADETVVAGLRDAQRVLPIPRHRTLAVEALRSNAPDHDTHVGDPSDIALMMLTSGSTGRPKGVPQPHRNLLARTCGSQQMHGWRRGMVTLNWMPLDHVAGLIYFHLRDVHLAARQVHVAAEDILRSPLLWLDLLERHRAQVTFAPNFAFGLVCGHADELARQPRDLAAVERILNGGEAIVAAPTRRFLQLLAPSGLRPDVMMPAWGMSEVSSGVTYDDGFRLDTTTDADPFVKVGRPVPGVRMRVVDDEGRLLREGQVGQLQLAGATVFDGYFRAAQSRAETFTDDGWFRTGDLARIDDGRLTITGRDKDVIIVNGANYAGPAIEAAVEELPGVARSYTAACAVADARAHGGEGLALFFVPELDGERELSDLLRAIRQKVTQTFGISPAVIVPLAREDIPKTSIGKIQRGALRKSLLQGEHERVLRRVDVLAANEHTLPRWFHRRVWCRCDASAPLRKPTAMLLFCAPSDATAQALAALVPDCTIVETGSDFARLGPRHFCIDARGLRAHASAIVETLRAESGRAPECAVWLCGTDDAGEPAGRCVAVTGAFADIAAGTSAHGGPLTLLAVTRGGARIADDEPLYPERALLGALVQTASQEFPNLRAVHVDIDDDAPERAARILGELAVQGERREVAWRGDRRWVAMLKPHAPETAGGNAFALRRGGGYVITGGLGGIGTELAAWLVERFDAKVLLVSRHSVDTPSTAQADDRQRQAAWERLQRLSPAISHACIDVCDRDALRRVLRLAAATWGAPAQAIFHLAGSYHEAPLAEEDAASLHAAFAAKVDGLAALLAVRDRGTAVVGFSSISSLFGGALVGAYAAANRALDAAIAHPDVWSLAWSAWHDTGLTRRFGAREPLRAMGVVDLPVAQALASLEIALTQAPGQFVIGLSPAAAYVARRSIDVPVEQTVTAFCESASPLPAANPIALVDRFGTGFALRLQRIDALPRTDAGTVDRGALERIVRHGSGLQGPRGAVETRLLALWQRLLGVQTISTDASFFELGGQSLLASRLVTSIDAEFNVHWSLRDVFESPTIASQAARLEGASDTALDAPARVDRQESQGLGSAQERLWFLDQIHPGNSAFNIPATIRFAQRPDPQRVQRALQALVDRHESLRTRFPMGGAVAHQVIADRLAVAMPVESLPAGASLAELAQAEARRPFDLAHGPLLRARLVDLPDGSATLLLALHHIVCDGWSMKVLFQDWLAAYESDAPLPPLALQYADFAAWQRGRLGSPDFAAQIAHWRARLGDRTDGFTLPTDRPRPTIQTQRGATVSHRIPAAVARRVRALARREGTTLFVTLLSAYAALLARYAQHDDIVVGTVVANRDRTEFEALIGFIVNVVVLRADLGADPRFRDILQRVHQDVLDAHAHHEVPFEALVEALRPQRDTSRSPLFQIAFDVRDPEITRSSAAGIAFGVMEADLGAAQYDLHLTLQESHDSEPALTALWQYNSDLFDRGTIERMAANYETLLADAASQPDRRLSRLALVSPAERGVLDEWNRRGAPFPHEACLHDLIEQQAARAPSRTALVHGAVEISYAELERRGNDWARQLQALGVGRDSIVGFCLERSIDLVVAMLAILKAGGAFLPLDPTYPQDRLDHMVSDSGIARLLTSSGLAPRFAIASAAGLQVLAMDADDPPAAPAGAASRSACPATPDSLAYVIYTSGSTGRPKGVLVEHRGWCNLAQAQQNVFGLRPGMRVLQFASASFDACAFEVAMALASGGTLVLADGASLMPGEPLAALLREQRVEVVTLPPTALAALPDGDYPDLKIVTAAGEACSQSLVRRFAGPGRRFFNLYGPTETTVWASYCECRADDPGEPPIGVPVPNFRLHVLDAHRELSPIGMPGELFIGGVGVARGYHRRPELDAERFLPDPFADAPGARMYRSGDIVRLDAAGQLEFLGRSDHQVKLRGFRIELGEIEAVLRACPAVGDVLVTLRRLADGDAALVAYLTPMPGQVVDVDEARAALQARLPRHMVPARIVPVDAFALTPNGKIDRARLPDPESQAAAPVPPAQLPRNEMESTIAAVWRQVLGREVVDRLQNFFDAGGHSLKMAQVHARLSEKLGRAVALVDLFQYPTIASLAAHLAAPAAPTSPAAQRPTATDPARATTPQAVRLATLAQRQRAARGFP